MKKCPMWPPRGQARLGDRIFELQSTKMVRKWRPPLSPAVPRCPSLSLAVPRSPSVSLAVPRCPSSSLAVSRCPSLSPARYAFCTFAIVIFSLQSYNLNRKKRLSPRPYAFRPMPIYISSRWDTFCSVQIVTLPRENDDWQGTKCVSCRREAV